ncbi:non-hydrolyzing UDP-N-acetylglucosamine 2-epimerase [Polycladidibacter stylochi]|uniref:non-hydrolyzing UDP-N-acetylglucosamine 2-epimerase n=1 Tax=Polycladidibacter stylochi TaxID=1807766 RepID=UPI000AE4EA85|nr:UDP-N-acetylglucosamine 2-epimerase (non-hydrolyzing) [Pseudovibrio stylochi]
MIKTVLCIVGTRPECIKVVSLVRELRRRENVRCVFLSTGQHREMLESAFQDLDIHPDIDLQLMEPNQSLAGLTSRLFSSLDTTYQEIQPDWVVVQGDTTTAFVGGTAAFYRGIKVAHLEAGLRSFDISAPFPEEFNRRALSLIAAKHYAPTSQSRDNLLNEQIPSEKIIITGNTGIDSLLHTAVKVRGDKILTQEIQDFIERYPKYVLVTAHRRENHGEGINSICDALIELSHQHQDIGFVLPVHLNPKVREIIHSKLNDIDNIMLTGPQSYKPFIALMDSSWMLLTDSGGVQEEAPSLSKPILVMRETTERPEGIEAGCAMLVGSNKAKICEQTNLLLTDQKHYNCMALAINPYGDGSASKYVADDLLA